MARVTVEDCVLKVPNRFELVMLAAQRARDISAGAPLSIDRDNDKNPVVALREIADETVSLDSLRNELVQGMQRHIEAEEPEEDELDRIAPAEAEAGSEAAPAGEEAQAEAEGGDETGPEGEGEVEPEAEASPEEEMAEDVLSVRESGTELPPDAFSADDLGDIQED